MIVKISQKVSGFLLRISFCSKDIISSDDLFGYSKDVLMESESLPSLIFPNMKRLQINKNINK